MVTVDIHIKQDKSLQNPTKEDDIYMWGRDGDKQNKINTQFSPPSSIKKTIFGSTNSI